LISFAPSANATADTPLVPRLLAGPSFGSFLRPPGKPLSLNSNSHSSGLDQVSSASAAAPDSPKIHKLRKAASEFEALLLSNWWRTMKESGWSDDSADSDPAKDTFDQLGIQTVSEAVANGGGFGIAKLLVHSLLTTLEAQKTQQESSAPNAVTHVK